MLVIRKIVLLLLLGQILYLLFPLNLPAEVNLSANSKKKNKYTDHGNGTVTDSSSGLMWQTTESIPQTWQQAQTYAQTFELAGFNDWRLPTIKELATLIDASRNNPAINTEFFPGCRSDAYWSATEYSQNPGFAWYVDFNDGLERNGGFKRRRYFIKFVRGGSPSQEQAKTSPSMVKKSPETKQKEKKIKLSLPRQRPETTKKEKDRLEPYPIGLDSDGEIIRLEYFPMNLDDGIKNNN